MSIGQGTAYDDARSYLVVEMRLVRAVVPRRERDELKQAVAQMIPPREIAPVPAVSGAMAESEFHERIVVVAEQLLAEYRHCSELHQGATSDQVRWIGAATEDTHLFPLPI